MILTDTGPLLALLNDNDRYHTQCLAALPGLPGPMVITLPVLAEAMYLLGIRFGWTGQSALWKMIHNGEIHITPIDGELLTRLSVLMEQYQDVPMDFADASLVAVAEAVGFPRIFTLDNHFYAYRLQNGQTLEVIPGTPR